MSDSSSSSSSSDSEPCCEYYSDTDSEKDYTMQESCYTESCFNSNKLKNELDKQMDFEKFSLGPCEKRTCDLAKRKEYLAKLSDVMKNESLYKPNAFENVFNNVFDNNTTSPTSPNEETTTPPPSEESSPTTQEDNTNEENEQFPGTSSDGTPVNVDLNSEGTALVFFKRKGKEKEYLTSDEVRELLNEARRKGIIMKDGDEEYFVDNSNKYYIDELNNGEVQIYDIVENKKTPLIQNRLAKVFKYLTGFAMAYNLWNFIYR